MASAWDFDVAVIGGGPGGSSAATALARRGRTVLLLERDRFPRFHIGESQLPWSNEVFRALGVHDAIAEAGFVKKWGASFRTVDGATDAQYEGIPRLEGRRAGDIRMFRRADMGWIWLIPISESVTSVGAVIPQSVHRRESKAVPEDSLTHYLTGTAGLAPLLAPARRLSPARFDADYSYLGSSLAGDRWIAVGDAAAFLDPIFSTGVLLAMQAGLEAAEAIDDSLRAGEPARHRFAACERLVRQRYHHFRRFAVGFYDPYFRDLWFRPGSRLGIFRAILSVLAGNLRPSWMTRLRIRFFFALVVLRRLLRLPVRAGHTPEP